MSSRQGGDNHQKEKRKKRKREKRKSNTEFQVHYIHHCLKSFPECGYPWEEEKWKPGSVIEENTHL